MQLYVFYNAQLINFIVVDNLNLKLGFMIIYLKKKYIFLPEIRLTLWNYKINSVKIPWFEGF